MGSKTLQIKRSSGGRPTWEHQLGDQRPNKTGRKVGSKIMGVQATAQTEKNGGKWDILL